MGKDPFESKDLESAPDAEADKDFGDTQLADGFSRLIEFVKREHDRKKRMLDPQVQARAVKLDRYKQQHLEAGQVDSKKGVQLKKAV